MKKAVAVVLAVVMMLALGATAFASNGPLSLKQAKQAALDYVGVSVSEAVFTKAHRDYDDGRKVYEIEFFVDNVEYEMNVDVYTGTVTDFNMEHHGGYYGDDPYDCDPYEHDFFDPYDFYDYD